MFRCCRLREWSDVKLDSVLFGGCRLVGLVTRPCGNRVPVGCLALLLLWLVRGDQLVVGSGQSVGCRVCDSSLCCSKCGWFGVIGWPSDQDNVRLCFVSFAFAVEEEMG